MEVAERGFGWSLLMIVLSTAVFLRASVGLFPYSGDFLRGSCTIVR